MDKNVIFSILVASFLTILCLVVSQSFPETGLGIVAGLGWALVIIETDKSKK